jgi:hypothetical protein
MLKVKLYKDSTINLIFMINALQHMRNSQIITRYHNILLEGYMQSLEKT